jgi:hypothetical protein
MIAALLVGAGIGWHLAGQSVDRSRERRQIRAPLLLPQFSSGDPRLLKARGARPLALERLLTVIACGGAAAWTHVDVHKNHGVV